MDTSPKAQYDKDFVILSVAKNPRPKNANSHFKFVDTSLCYAKFSMTNKGRFRPLFSCQPAKRQTQKVSKPAQKPTHKKSLEFVDTSLRSV